MKGNRGFVKLVILIVVVLIVLGYYGFNLKQYLDSPTVKENLSTFWELIVKGWNIFIVTPALWLWNKIQPIIRG